MRFIDNQGREISREAWAQLIRDRRHTLIKRTTCPDGCVVQTSWQGLVSDFEDIPKIYLTEIGHPHGGGHRFLSEAIWSATREQALIEHQWLQAQHAA